MLTTTAYLPPFSWFVAALHAGSWQWEAHEHYQKGGYRNRCRIATANGPLLLTVPLTGGKHQQMPIREVRIDYRQDWPRQHAQTIRSAYGRAPYFEYYADELLALITQPRECLWDHNLALTRHLITTLQLPIELFFTRQFQGGIAGAMNPGSDLAPYRQVFEERHGFLGDLSVLDALFCLGPELAAHAN